MKFFYSVLLWFAETELVIARSTGRNPDHIAALAADVQRWSLAMWQEEWKL